MNKNKCALILFVFAFDYFVAVGFYFFALQLLALL